MSFQHASVPDLLAAINLANTIALTTNDVTWSVPQVVQGTWRDQVTSKNTAINIVANEGNPNYQGIRAILYDRLKLQELANIKGFSVQSPEVATTHEILPALKIFTGLQISVDDIEDTPILDNGDGTHTAVLTAKATSKGWIGAVNLPITAGGMALDDAIIQPALTGLNYPTTLDNGIFALVYTYGYDFTAFFDDIEDIVPSDGNGEVHLSYEKAGLVAAALRALDVSSGRTLWSNDGGTAAWSLFDAVVIYNGLNNSSLPTNQDYKYVLGLRLRPGVDIPSGEFYLHYNDPFDPNA